MYFIFSTNSNKLDSFRRWKHQRNKAATKLIKAQKDLTGKESNIRMKTKYDTNHTSEV